MGDGLHLVIDGTMRKVLTSSEVSAFLLGCAEAIGMTVIDGPNVYDLPSEITGIVIIAESHIILHVYPNQTCSLDVFSCKPFSESQAIIYCVATLGLASLRTNKLHRGWDNGSLDTLRSR